MKYHFEKMPNVGDLEIVRITRTPPWYLWLLGFRVKQAYVSRICRGSQWRFRSNGKLAEKFDAALDRFYDHGFQMETPWQRPSKGDHK